MTENKYCPDGHKLQKDAWTRRVYTCNACDGLVYEKDIRNKCKWCGDYNVPQTGLAVCGSCGHAHPSKQEKQ